MSTTSPRAAGATNELPQYSKKAASPAPLGPFSATEATR